MSTVVEALDILHEGDLVEFTYQQESGSGRKTMWKCVAVFLESRVEPRASYAGGDVLISFRPLAGTGNIPTEDIRGVRLLKHHTSRLGQRGDEGVRLPYRISAKVPS